MSTWTEVTGIIVCDWCSFSYPDKKQVKLDIITRKQKLDKILNTNIPEGSEHPLYTKYLNGNNYNVIIITGSLRDFNSIDIKEKIEPWWDYIMKNIDHVRQAVMSCTCCRKTYIFEKRISHDADLGGTMRELYGPDPGIFVCSNRNVTKDDNKIKQTRK